ncbi:MAG: hypothetical protein ACK2TW_02695 [Anaerolineales bacterium]
MPQTAELRHHREIDPGSLNHKPGTQRGWNWGVIHSSEPPQQPGEGCWNLPEFAWQTG